MYEITYESEYTACEERQFIKYFEGLKIGFFDIETTGLSAEHCRLILAGISIPQGDRLISMQFLAEDPSEEPQVIRRALEVVDALDIIVTYNGRRFDIPFLEKRCISNKIHLSRPLPYNLDLLSVLRTASPLKKLLPDLKQKTIEKFLGLEGTRDDEITGGDSVELYYIYAGTKDERLRQVILLHNADDIRQLAKLPAILEKCDLHKALTGLGMPCGNGYISTLELTKSQMKLAGIQRTEPISTSWYDDFHSGIAADFDEVNKTFSITIPLISEEGFLLADLTRLPVSLEDFERLPSYGEGYLILKEGKKENHEEINRLAMELTTYIYEKFREQ